MTIITPPVEPESSVAMMIEIADYIQNLNIHAYVLSN